MHGHLRDLPPIGDALPQDRMIGLTVTAAPSDAELARRIRLRWSCGRCGHVERAGTAFDLRGLALAHHAQAHMRRA